MRDAAELDLLLQIGTTVSRHNLSELAAIGDRVAGIGATVWTVFFLVPTGRGQAADMLTPVQHEQVLHWLHDYARTAPFHVRTIAAQHYRRVVIQSRNAAATSTEPRWEYTGAGFSARVHKRASATRGVNDGNGFCFVSHVGDVYPSGFLQIKAGNVREQTLSQIYRDSPLFRSLRDPSRLKGKCGVCEYRAVCGGSRARAFAMTGDHLASDPSCVYNPPAIAS